MTKIMAVMAMAVMLAACDDGGAGDDDATAENCTNTVDDDMDGMIDCADTDCSTNAACMQTGEVCDDHMDNDGDGIYDCSDTDCATTKPARGSGICLPGSHGDFEAGDGSYSSGSGTCEFTTGFAATIFMYLSGGGVVFPVLGENTNAFFSFVQGTTDTAEGEGFTVLGAGGHTCTVVISGTAVKIITITCTNAQGGSCTMSYSFVG